MRILKFFGAFLITFIVIFFLTFGFRLDSLFTLFENREDIQEGQEWVEKTYSLKGLTEYIGAQPQRVSVASISIENPDSSIFYNQHTPRTMGRLTNIFTLIEYVRQAEAGTLNPGEQVPLEDVNKYQLPYMDESNHENAIKTLREQEKISTNGTVALSDLVQTAIKFNDTAIADFLLFKMGLDNIEDLYDRLSLEETELPLPFSGLYIILQPGKADTSAQAHFNRLSQLSIDEFRNQVVDNARRLYGGADFREEIMARFHQNEGLGIKFTKQRDALVFFPKTTAQEMSQLMQRIQQEALLSPVISKKVKAFLDWPLEDKDGRLNKDFKAYGALYDNRMGMVNGIDYGQSSYSEEPFAQAVFFDELQIAFWFHMSSNFMHQDFEQRLIWDPAMRAATIGAIRDSRQSKNSTK